MPQDQQIRNRAWAISAVMIGVWNLSKLYPSLGYLFEGTSILVLITTLPFIAWGLALVVGGTGLLLRKPWGRKVLKYAIAIGAAYFLAAIITQTTVTLLHSSHLEDGWAESVKRQYAPVKLFIFWRNIIENIAQLAYYALLYREIALMSEESAGDEAGSETAENLVDRPRERGLFWATSALLVGCWYIHRLTAASYSTIFSHEHGRSITRPGEISWELSSEYHLLRYVLDVPSQYCSAALRIKSILFTIPHLSLAFMGIALIIGSIGLIKQKAWGLSVLTITSAAGVILTVLGLIMPHVLARDPQMIALTQYALAGYLRAIFAEHTTRYAMETVLSGVMWTAYFALLLRQMTAKEGELPAETNSMSA